MLAGSHAGRSRWSNPTQRASKVPSEARRAHVIQALAVEEMPTMPRPFFSLLRIDDLEADGALQGGRGVVPIPLHGEGPHLYKVIG